MTQFYAFFSLHFDASAMQPPLSIQGKYCNICQRSSAIFDRDFTSSNLHFPYSFWTFIPLFALDFYFPSLFGLFFQFCFNSFSILFYSFSFVFQFFFIQSRSHFGFLPNFWLLAYFSGSFGDQNTEQLYLKIIKGIFSVFSNEMTFYSTAWQQSYELSHIHVHYINQLDFHWDQFLKVWRKQFNIHKFTKSQFTNFQLRNYFFYPHKMKYSLFHRDSRSWKFLSLVFIEQVQHEIFFLRNSTQTLPIISASPSDLRQWERTITTCKSWWYTTVEWKGHI